MIQSKSHLTLGQHKLERFEKGVCMFACVCAVGWGEGCGRGGPRQVASIEVSPVCLPVGFVLLEKLLSWHENTE